MITVRWDSSLTTTDEDKETARVADGERKPHGKSKKFKFARK